MTLRRSDRPPAPMRVIRPTKKTSCSGSNRSFPKLSILKSQTPGVLYYIWARPATMQRRRLSHSQPRCWNHLPNSPTCADTQTERIQSSRKAIQIHSQSLATCKRYLIHSHTGKTPHLYPAHIRCTLADSSGVYTRCRWSHGPAHLQTTHAAICTRKHLSSP